MIYLLVAAAADDLTVHRWTETVPLAGILWAIIAVLGGAVVWYALGDRTEIKETLKKLVSVIEDLRLDLAENYAKKIEVERLDRKVERLRERMTLRRAEQDSVEDAERP